MYCQSYSVQAKGDACYGTDAMFACEHVRVRTMQNENLCSGLSLRGAALPNMLLRHAITSPAAISGFGAVCIFEVGCNA